MFNTPLFMGIKFPHSEQHATTESLVKSWREQGPMASWQKMGIALFDQTAHKQLTEEAISLYGEYWSSAIKITVELMRNAKYPFPSAEMTHILQDSQKSLFEKTAMLRDLHLTQLQSLVGQQVNNTID